MPRPVHFEIHSSDPEKARDFYGSVFGWTFQQHEDNAYWLVMTEEPHEHSDDDELHEHEPGINGGLMPRPDEGERMNAFVCTMEVASCDATAQQVVDAGGTVVMPAEDMPGVGRIAYAVDPDGNTFGLFQALEERTG